MVIVLIVFCLTIVYERLREISRSIEHISVKVSKEGIFGLCILFLYGISFFFIWYMVYETFRSCFIVISKCRHVGNLHPTLYVQLYINVEH
jgi:hypothetical protein